MLERKSLSNLQLSSLGADIATGEGYFLGAGGGRTSIGDTFRNVNRITQVGNYGLGALQLYNASNISFSKIFNQNSISGAESFAFMKGTPVDAGQWRSDLGTYYTSSPSASGALIAGTNGDLSGHFIGYGPNYESYYMWGGPSKHWRIGINIYRLSADGHEFQRVYTHHHIADAISDQGGLSIGLGDYSPSNNIKVGGAIFRNQGDGRPYVSIGGYNISNNTFNGNNWLTNNAIYNVSEWGQPLDATSLQWNGNRGNRNGLILWQRQWWGPRLIAFSHNNSSIVYQTSRSLDVFYQGWIYDHNFSGQGGVAYSPKSGVATAIFQYEPNGTTYGRNLAINSVRIYEADTDYPVIDDRVDTHLIHFIWGENDPCRQDLGQYSAAAIEHLGYWNNMAADVYAYAFINPNNDLLWVRMCYRNWDEPANNRCSFPDFGEQAYGGINHLQRVRVVRLNTVIEYGGFHAYFALSYVNNENLTIVRIFRGGDGIDGLEEVASYIPNARGILARNGSADYQIDNGNGTGQHAIVIGTTNDGYQDTYIWGSKGSYLGRSGDQDLTRAIKLV